MSTLTRIKLALTLMGLILFFAGVRFDDERLRWGAIALVGIAWVMRFARRRDGASDAPPGDGAAPNG